MKKILIVDDEPDILELLEYNLTKEDFLVEKASNGEDALLKVKSFHPEIILMDVMMPKMDGIEACRKIREDFADLNPYIVFLTARSEEFTEVAAWEAGGNDFLIKPIKPRALISRLKSKRNNNNPELARKSEQVNISGLVIDRSSYTVIMNSEQYALPKKEFNILFLLAQHPNKIFSREEILNIVWEEDTYVLSRTVDVHIRKLREKLGEHLIKTIKGVGYMFINDAI